MSLSAQLVWQWMLYFITCTVALFSRYHKVTQKSNSRPLPWSFKTNSTLVQTGWHTNSLSYGWISRVLALRHWDVVDVEWLSGCHPALTGESVTCLLCTLDWPGKYYQSTETLDHLTWKLIWQRSSSFSLCWRRLPSFTSATLTPTWTHLIKDRMFHRECVWICSLQTRT